MKCDFRVLGGVVRLYERVRAIEIDDGIQRYDGKIVGKLENAARTGSVCASPVSVVPVRFVSEPPTRLSVCPACAIKPPAPVSLTCATIVP